MKTMATRESSAWHQLKGLHKDNEKDEEKVLRIKQDNAV